jgi:hypothetical protein
VLFAGDHKLLRGVCGLVRRYAAVPVAIILWLIASLSASAQIQPSLSLSGVYIRIIQWPDIHWLDDRTVLFHGYPQGKPRDHAEFQSWHPSLFLWTIGSAPQPYAQEMWFASAGVQYYCAEAGSLYYSTTLRFDPRTGETFRRFLVGAPGSELITEKRLNPDYDHTYTLTVSPKNKAGMLGGLPCDRRSDERMIRRYWASDYSGTFYLDFGPEKWGDTVDYAVVLMRADGRSRKELPIRRVQVLPNCTQYDKHSDSFLIRDCGDYGTVPANHARWRETGCHSFWWVRLPEGKVEEVCLPYRGSFSVIDVLPTRAGLYFTSLHSRDSKGPQDPGSAGLYRLDGPSVTRVLPGMLVNASVSPNGCRLAFTYSPNPDAWAMQSKEHPTVASIDVCEAATPSRE